MGKVDDIHNFAETFLRIINKFKALEKIPIDHGTGDLLYASEINTLEIIGKFFGPQLKPDTWARNIRSPVLLIFRS